MVDDIQYSVLALTYVRVISKDDSDIPQFIRTYKNPCVSRFISISDNYFHYVTNSENVFFYKVYESEKLIGAVHLEKNENLLYMDILVILGNVWVLLVIDLNMNSTR